MVCQTENNLDLLSCSCTVVKGTTNCNIIQKLYYYRVCEIVMQQSNGVALQPYCYANTTLSVFLLKHLELKYINQSIVYLK